MDAPRVRGFRAVLDVLVSIALIAAACSVVYTNVRAHSGPGERGRTGVASRPPEPLPPTPVSLDGAATAGSTLSRIVLIMFSDFQCPYCGKFARETLPIVKKEYVEPGRVQIVFRNLPLPMHQFATGAAETADCARRQDRFWDMHDSIFADQQHLDSASLMTRAEVLKLSMPTLQTCLSGDSPNKIKSDVTIAEQLAIHVTPTFLAGIRTVDGKVRVTKRFSGALPIAQFKKVLDGLIEIGSKG